MIRIGVIAVSDRASAGHYDDRGTPALVSYLEQTIVTEHICITRLIPKAAVSFSPPVELVRRPAMSLQKPPKLSATE